MEVSNLLSVCYSIGHIIIIMLMMAFLFPGHLCQAGMCVMPNGARTVAGITIYK